MTPLPPRGSIRYGQSRPASVRYTDSPTAWDRLVGHTVTHLSCVWKRLDRTELDFQLRISLACPGRLYNEFEAEYKNKEEHGGQP